MRAACAAAPRSGAARLATALAKFPGWAAHGTSSNDAPHTTSVVGTNATSIACRSRGEASRGTKPNVNSFQFACLLSLAVMLVFAGFLPPTSPRAHDPSDEVSRQGGRFASGGEAASFQVLGISCVAYPALAQLPTCVTCPHVRMRASMHRPIHPHVASAFVRIPQSAQQVGHRIRVHHDVVQYRLRRRVAHRIRRRQSQFEGGIATYGPPPPVSAGGGGSIIIVGIVDIDRPFPPIVASPSHPSKAEEPTVDRDRGGGRRRLASHVDRPRRRR